jgi:hypothetical protein
VKNITRPFFRFSFAMQVACALVACGGRPDMAEIVLCTGSKVAVRGAGSTLTAGATSLTTRSYVVDDFDLVIELIPRFQRWNGNLGLYRPAGKGDTHTILEEGQQFFSNEEDLYQWIAWARRWGGELRYTSDGLLMRWQVRHRGAEEIGPKRSLNVDVVQLMLRGRKPHALQGADDAAFTITNAKSGCVVGAAMHSTYVASEPARIAGRAYSGWARDVMKAHEITYDQVEDRIAHGRARTAADITTYSPQPGGKDWRQSYVVQVDRTGKVILVFY